MASRFLLADDANWTIIGHSAASKTYPDKESFMREVIRKWQPITRFETDALSQF
jgi:hypothetical protein